MAGGRPTKYTDEMPQRLRDYFLNAKPYEEAVGENGKTQITPQRLPTLERFAINQGVHTDTLYEWAANNSEFSVALREAKAAQRDLLMQGGLMGGYKDTIAKLILSSCHGMSDKVIQEVTGKDGGPQQIEAKVTISPEDAYKAMLG